MRSNIAAALFLAGAASTFAQQPPRTCSTFLTMYVYDEKLGLILAPGMTSDQSRWFESKGKKTYPDFCFSSVRATYVVVTVRWTENQQRTVTKTESATTTGPVTTVAGLSSSGPGQPAQPIWRTELGSFLTTWQTRVNEVVREPHAFVLVYETKDGKPLSDTTELRSEPVLQAKGVGRNAGRDALEFVFKNWSMKLTKSQSKQ
jgi:hypothetical protein